MCREQGKGGVAKAHLGTVQALPCVVWKLTTVALLPRGHFSHHFPAGPAEAHPEHSRLNALDLVSTALVTVFSRLEKRDRVSCEGSWLAKRTECLSSASQKG